jgi:nicotinamide mononucleotide adenylyltransferase
VNLLEEANKLASQLVTQITESPEKPKRPDALRTIAIFSGRFQPFHEGHYHIYRHLVEQFGEDNVFIASTDGGSENELNPLSFDDKKHLITVAFNINSQKVQKVENSYIPKEILEHFDPNITAFVTIVSDEAIPVLAHSKYFKRYIEGLPPRPFKENGYFLPLPEILARVGKTELTDSLIWEILGSDRVSEEVKNRLIDRLWGQTPTETKEMLKKKAQDVMSGINGNFAGVETDAGNRGRGPALSPTDTKDRPYPQAKAAGDGKKKGSPLDDKILNPETDREIKVRSALKYPRWTPVYKAAEKKAKAAGVDRKNRVEDPEVNQRYRSRARKHSTTESLGAELAQSILEQNPEVVINLPEVGEIRLPLMEAKHAPIIVFSGRFQPFHLGHYHSYEVMVTKFGKENVFIATTDNTDDENSPFTFDEKKLIMTKMFGISEHQIVKVKNAYQAKEITDNLPHGTPVIWVLGEKDSERLKHSKYFKQFNTNTELEGSDREGYVIIAPQTPLKIGDKVISGKELRSALSSGKNQTEIFQAAFGKLDDEIFNLVTSKLASRPSPKRSRDLSGKIKNPETGNDILIKTALSYDPNHPARKAAEKKLKNESFLVEAGAFGHISHLYDDPTLTFRDIKSIITRALSGELNTDGPVTEKTDGQNILFTVRDGEVRFARSLSQVKNAADNAMTVGELAKKFEGRGNIEKTFSSAGHDIQTAIEKLGFDRAQEMFDNGKRFMSVEIINPDSENIIPYEKSLLIFHGTVTFDENGKPIKFNVDDSLVMARALQSVAADKQEHYGIRGQPFVILSTAQSSDLKIKSDKYIKELDSILLSFGLTDDDTVADYKFAWWMNKLKDAQLDPNEKHIVINHWAQGKKAAGVFGKISNSPKIKFVKTIDSRLTEFNGEAVLPIQKTIVKVGIDALSRATDLLAAGNPLAAKKIREKLFKAIEQIKNSNDERKLALLSRLSQTLEDIDLNNLIPSEGLVFSYKGKLYKLTGVFGPINQIVGAVKFGKLRPRNISSADSPASEPERLSYSPELLTKTIKNPETGNTILIKTALKYPKNHPAHKAAQQFLQRHK